MFVGVRIQGEVAQTDLGHGRGGLLFGGKFLKNETIQTEESRYSSPPLDLVLPSWEAGSCCLEKAAFSDNGRRDRVSQAKKIKKKGKPGRTPPGEILAKEGL